MISTSELRIGNTVQDVIELEKNLTVFILEPNVIRCGDESHSYPYLPEHLKGIPLSPEILERYGFVEADDDGKYNLKKVWGVSLQHRYLADDGYDLYIFKQFIVQIHHLHHLQNVFHALALTNTELTAREG